MSCDPLQFHHLSNCSYPGKWIRRAWGRKAGQKKILLVIYSFTEADGEECKMKSNQQMLKSENSNYFSPNPLEKKAKVNFFVWFKLASYSPLVYPTAYGQVVAPWTVFTDFDLVRFIHFLFDQTHMNPSVCLSLSTVNSSINKTQHKLLRTLQDYSSQDHFFF